MNQNETNPLTADQTLRKWCEYTYPSLSDAAKMALQTACLSYAAQQVEQVIEERDELARLISDSPLCDTVVDPTLQRAWEACTTLCEKAEFKYLFKYAQNMEKRAKTLTEERDKAVALVRRCFQSHDLPGWLYMDIRDFLNSLDAGREAGEK